MVSMDTTTDAVVVGGGLAGLTAATYLARAGRRVTVIEKASEVGGRAATQLKDGFAMNLGPHALYCAGAAQRVLAELGIQVTGRVPPTSGGFAVRDGRLHTLPTGFVSLLTTSILDLPGRLEAGRFLASIGRIDTAPLARVSARAWMDERVRSPAVRGLLAMLFRVSNYAADFDRLSAGAALAQLELAVRANVRYLDGGWRTIVAGLRQAALDAGAAIVTGARAEEVLVDGGRTTGVRLADGTVVGAHAVVVAASPSAASALVPGSASLAAFAARAIPVKAACLDLALAKLPRKNGLVALGVDRPLYLSVHSASARLAPEGAALVHLAKYLGGPEPEGDPEAELEALMEEVQPGYRQVLVDRRFMPSLVVSNALVTAADGGLAGRPNAAVPEVRGLFVAGDWVGAEGMLADATVASARVAAKLALAARQTALAA
jgi:phytoene dehydrogenase-like protein